MSSFATDSTGRVVSTVRMVRSQPSWVMRAALIVFFFVVGLPILLLLTLAFVLAVIVFGSLALIHAVAMRVRGAIPGHSGGGRSNVRVIVRDDRP